MKPWDQAIIREALEFAGRWGFITRDLFFDYMCPRSRARQFFYWAHLVDQGLFVRSKADSLVLILSKKGRIRLGKQARPARQSVYVAHDAIAARVFLAFQKRRLIGNFWLEDELMRNPLEAFNVLGAESVHRVPDLVFDVKIKDGIVRCALEIERTTKTQSRYAKLALAYLGYSKIGVVLFGCGSHATEFAINRAFSGRVFAECKRVPGLFQYDEFDPETLSTVIRFQDRGFSIMDLLLIMTKSEVPSLNLLRDRNETGVSLKKSKNKEAG